MLKTRSIVLNNNGIAFINSGFGTREFIAARSSVSRNVQAGVVVTDPGSTGNTITQDSIDGNGGLGIDLGGDGVTNNDDGDGESWIAEQARLVLLEDGR